MAAPKIVFSGVEASPKTSPVKKSVPPRLHLGASLHKAEIDDNAEGFDETRLRLFGLLFNKTPRAASPRKPLKANDTSSSTGSTRPVRVKAGSSNSSPQSKGKDEASTAADEVPASPSASSKRKGRKSQFRRKKGNSKKPNSARSSAHHAMDIAPERELKSARHRKPTEKTTKNKKKENPPPATRERSATLQTSPKKTPPSRMSRRRSTRMKRMSMFGALPRHREVEEDSSDSPFPGINFHSLGASAPVSGSPFPGINFHEVKSARGESFPGIGVRVVHDDSQLPQSAREKSARGNDFSSANKNKPATARDDRKSKKKSKKKGGKAQVVPKREPIEIVEVTTRDIKMEDGSELLQVWFAGEHYKTLAVHPEITASAVCELGLRKLALAEKSSEVVTATVGADLIRLYLILDDNMRGLRVLKDNEKPIALRAIAEQQGLKTQFVFNLARPCIHMELRKATLLRWATWMLNKQQAFSTLDLSQSMGGPSVTTIEYLATGVPLLQLAAEVAGVSLDANLIPEAKKLERKKHRLAAVRSALEMVRTSGLATFVDAEKIEAGDENEILDLLWVFSFGYHARQLGTPLITAFEYFLGQLIWCREHISQDEGYGGADIRDLSYSFCDGLALNALISGLAPGHLNPSKLTSSVTENVCLALLKADKLYRMPKRLLDFKFFEGTPCMDDLAISTYLAVLRHQSSRYPAPKKRSKSIEGKEGKSEDEIQASHSSKATDSEVQTYDIVFRGFPRAMNVPKTHQFTLSSTDPSSLQAAIEGFVKYDASSGNGIIRVKWMDGENMKGTPIGKLDNLPFASSQPVLHAIYLIRKKRAQTSQI